MVCTKRIVSVERQPALKLWHLYYTLPAAFKLNSWVRSGPVDWMPITCWDCSYAVPWSESKWSSQRLRKDSLQKIFRRHPYLYKTKYNAVSDLEEASEALKMKNFIGIMWVNRGLKKANKRERKSSSDQRSVADRSVEREKNFLRQQAELKFQKRREWKCWSDE